MSHDRVLPLEVEISRTQAAFAGLFTKPKLTEKLLRRPPIRFLHDVVTATEHSSGFLKKHFGNKELVPDTLRSYSNIQSKSDKINFISTLTTLLERISGDTLRVRPKDVVAGRESAVTNHMLQVLAAVARSATKQLDEKDVGSAQVEGEVGEFAMPRVVSDDVELESTSRTYDFRKQDEHESQNVPQASEISASECPPTEESKTRESFARATERPFWEVTQSTLGAIISKPILKTKLLKRPPFRFLFDIVRSVTESTTFLRGAFSAALLEQKTIKDPQEKLWFLNRMRRCVEEAIDREIPVKATQVIAGTNAEATNYLLQSLAEAIERDPDMHEILSRVDRTSEDKNQRCIDSEATRHHDKPEETRRRGDSEETRRYNEPKEAPLDLPPDAKQPTESPRPDVPKLQLKKIQAEETQGITHGLCEEEFSDENESAFGAFPASTVRPAHVPELNLQSMESKLPTRGQQEATPHRFPDSTRVLADREISQRLQTHRRMERPKTARRAPPRRQPQPPELEPPLSAETPHQVEGVMFESSVEKSASAEQEQIASSIEGPSAHDSQADHGALVQELLEAYQGSSEDEVVEMLRTVPPQDRRTVLALEETRTSIGALCEAVEPLGRLVQFASDDLHGMRRQFRSFSEECRQLQEKLQTLRLESKRSLSYLTSDLRRLQEEAWQESEHLQQARAELWRRSQQSTDLLVRVSKQSESNHRQLSVVP